MNGGCAAERPAHLVWAGTETRPYKRRDAASTWGRLWFVDREQWIVRCGQRDALVQIEYRVGTQNEPIFTIRGPRDLRDSLVGALIRGTASSAR